MPSNSSISEPQGPLPAGLDRWASLPVYRGGCKHYLIQVPKEKIGIVNAILESFDHAARVFTKDPERSILQVTVTEDWDDVIQPAIRRLAETVPLRFVQETDLSSK